MCGSLLVIGMERKVRILTSGPKTPHMFLAVRETWCRLTSFASEVEVAAAKAFRVRLFRSDLSSWPVPRREEGASCSVVVEGDQKRAGGGDQHFDEYSRHCLLTTTAPVYLRLS